jgi:hypothetical protein
LIPAGFGSVAEGQGGGVVTDMSTQAVLELIKNVSCPNDGSQDFIGIDVEDVELFFIDREGSKSSQTLTIGKCCSEKFFKIF